MSDVMKGTRVEWASQILNPGEYTKLPDGTWHGETPNGHGANLERHQITEHEDGTITASPSILVFKGVQKTTSYVELWHGFLERGVWRSV